MLLGILASSNSHDNLWIKVLGARVVVVFMDRPCHRRVPIDAVVDGRVCVRLRWVGVVGDVGRRLALVGHSICHERSGLLTRICHRVQQTTNLYLL